MPTIQKVGRALLAAQLFLSPLLFWRATTEVFEFNKVVLLVAVAAGLVALGVPAFLTILDDIRRGRNSASLRSVVWGQDPLSAGVLLFVLSAALSTAFSVNPLTSWRG